MTEKDEKLSIENLDEAAGGGTFEYYDRNNEAELIAHDAKIDTPIYCCPRCMSRNVINYDPGAFNIMRVKCNDCGYFGDRGSISETEI